MSGPPTVKVSNPVVKLDGTSTGRAIALAINRLQQQVLALEQKVKELQDALP